LLQAMFGEDQGLVKTRFGEDQGLVPGWVAGRGRSRAGAWGSGLVLIEG
jgi:hypothetical protein